jgi:hypothetical protein
MRTTILVLANKTVGSDELFAALRARAERGPVRLELVAPPDAPGPEGRAEARARLDQALARAKEAGWEATGRVGPPDALDAVLDAYDARRHDEIIVSTLPPSVSHWLGIDLPARVARATNALVTHVAVPEPRARARSRPLERPVR